MESNQKFPKFKVSLHVLCKFHYMNQCLLFHWFTYQFNYSQVTFAIKKLQYPRPKTWIISQQEITCLLLHPVFYAIGKRHLQAVHQSKNYFGTIVWASFSISSPRFSHQTPAVEAWLDSSLLWHFSIPHLFTPQAFTTVGLPKSFVREMLFRQHCLDVKEIPNKGKPAMKKEAASR